MRNSRALIRVAESLNGQLATPSRHVLYSSRQKYGTIASGSIPHLKRSLIQQSSQRNITTTSSLNSYLQLQKPMEPLQEPNTIKIGTEFFDKTLLRDACPCPECVDPSTTQRNFRTTDVASEDWKVRSVDISLTHTTIIWKRKRKDEQHVSEVDEQHISIFANHSLNPASEQLSYLKRDYSTLPRRGWSWDASQIGKYLEFFDYKEYMNSEGTLHQALNSLSQEGLVILKDVPESEKSVEEIAGRIGSIRDTFYGRTWDVKSVPEAKNVAYTSKYLGLHMDLLYMANPPGFQLLHCLKNTAKGGDSIFSDCKRAAEQLTRLQYKALALTPIAYHYKNAGEHYHYSHPVIELETVHPTYFKKRTPVRHFNYSPPFQAPYALRNSGNPPGFLDALSRFSSLVEAPENLFSYKLKEGECVVFNNRRILHGRQAFDAEGGERWLKGTYVDTDVVASRLRVLSAKYPWEIRNKRSEDATKMYIS